MFSDHLSIPGNVIDAAGLFVIKIESEAKSNNRNNKFATNGEIVQSNE